MVVAPPGISHPLAMRVAILVIESCRVGSGVSWLAFSWVLVGVLGFGGRSLYSLVLPVIQVSVFRGRYHLGVARTSQTQGLPATSTDDATKCYIH